jgi:hypothetical protein
VVFGVKDAQLLRDAAAKRKTVVRGSERRGARLVELAGIDENASEPMSSRVCRITSGSTGGVGDASSRYISALGIMATSLRPAPELSLVTSGRHCKYATSVEDHPSASAVERNSHTRQGTPVREECPMRARDDARLGYSEGESSRSADAARAHPRE